MARRRIASASAVMRAVAVLVSAGLAVGLLLFPAVATAAPGEVLLAADFDASSMPAGLTPVVGTWTTGNGVLTGASTNTGQQSRITLGTTADDYVVDFDFSFQSVVANNPSAWLGVGVDVTASNPTEYVVAQQKFAASIPTGVSILRRSSGAFTALQQVDGPADYQIGSVGHATLSVQGSRLTWWINGVPWLTAVDVPRTPGEIALMAGGAAVAFDNLRIVRGEPAPSTNYEPVATPGVSSSMVGHRGANRVAPENTVSSLNAAEAAGAQAIEFDVQWTSDDVPVLMHDSTVDRTTNGTGSVRSLPYSTVSTLDAGSWFSPAFTGERVPTLEDAARAMANGRANLIVDIKATLTVKQTAILVRTLRAWIPPERLLLQSSSLTDLGRLRAFAADMDRMYLLNAYTGTAETLLDRMRSVDAAAINLSWPVGASVPGLVTLIHADHRGVSVFDTDDACTWLAAATAGVDLIGANDLEQFTSWELQAGMAPWMVADYLTPLENEDYVVINAYSLPRVRAFSVAIDGAAKILATAESSCWGSFQVEVRIPKSGIRPAPVVHEFVVLDAAGTVLARQPFTLNPQKAPDEESDHTPKPSASPSSGSGSQPETPASGSNGPDSVTGTGEQGPTPTPTATASPGPGPSPTATASPESTPSSTIEPRPSTSASPGAGGTDDSSPSGSPLSVMLLAVGLLALVAVVLAASLIYRSIRRRAAG